MKLITLNIWGGHVHAPLVDFFRTHQDIDIFCLQEVYHDAPHQISTEERKVQLNIFSELTALLPEHRAFFRPTVQNIYGIGILIKNHIDVLSEGEIMIHENVAYTGQGPEHSRKLQWMECQLQDKIYAILNVHCLWNGRGKTDTPERIMQSQRIKAFMNTLSMPKVLCGDFNLRPDTKSIKIISEEMNNLVERYGVTSTRTRFYPKEEKFADYIFTSPEIQVNHFEVLKDQVSDHAPLLLEFSTASQPTRAR